MHDVGGMQWSGPVVRETEDTAFREPWEGRVFGLQLCLRQQGCFSLRDIRDATERLDPVLYFGSSFYLRRLRAISLLLHERRIVDVKELNQMTQSVEHQSPQADVRRLDPELAARIEHHVRSGNPTRIAEADVPRFQQGAPSFDQKRPSREAHASPSLRPREEGISRLALWCFHLSRSLTRSTKRNRLTCLRSSIERRRAMGRGGGRQSERDAQRMGEPSAGAGRLMEATCARG